MLTAQPSFAAATPCDSLRDYLTGFARDHPDLTLDTGRAEFLNLALRIKIARPDNFIDGPLSGCDEMKQWFRAANIDSTAFDHQDMDCYFSGEFYDARPFGGFLLLTDRQRICTDVMILFVTNNAVSFGPSDCWSQFLMLSDGGKLWPTSLEGLTGNPGMSYRLRVYSGTSASLGRHDALCKIDVVYAPRHTVNLWLGPKGPGDVDAALRNTIEPILLERAAGRDARELTDAIHDSADGATAYDHFLKRSSAGPNRVEADSDDRRWLPMFIPFGSTIAEVNARATYSSFTEIDDGDVTALRINGRRLLLAFGNPNQGTYTLNDFGFALWEWNGSDFEPVASGYMGRTGTNPEVK